MLWLDALRRNHTRLSSQVGEGGAMLPALTGSLLDTREARRIDLVEEVFENEELVDVAQQLAGLIA